MKIEALNCPNCGSGVSSDKTNCLFCGSRLKTMACPSCFGLMFVGSRHCSHCGASTVEPQILSDQNLGVCPRCQFKLNLLEIGVINLRECQKCSGVWAQAKTFETICAEHENQAAVLNWMAQKPTAGHEIKVQYVPCPDCRQLMNRHNFARSSGVIIDICKQHGVWFDPEELPRIIEFIRQGGLDHQRRKEKLQLEEERKLLRDEQRKLAIESSKLNQPISFQGTPTTIAVREFVRFLFD